MDSRWERSLDTRSGDESSCEGLRLVLSRHQAPDCARSGGLHGQMGLAIHFDSLAGISD